MPPANESGRREPPAANAAVPGGPRGHGGLRGGPVQKPKNFKATVGRLWSYFSGERKRLAAVLAFVLSGSALGLLGPYLVGVAVDAIAKEGGVDFRLLDLALIALIVSYVADAGFSFLQGWLMSGVSQRVVERLRGALFAKMHKLPLAFFDTRSHGEVMSRLSNDIDNVSTTVSQTTAQLMSGVFAIAGSLVMMLALSPLLTLATLVTVPLVFLLAGTIAKRTKILFKEQQAQLGALNGHIEETVSGMLAVKAFNREEDAVRRFDQANAKLAETGIKAQIWSGFLMPLLGVINNIGFAAVAIVGGALAVGGDVSVGVIASFLSYSRQFVRPLNEIASVYNTLQAGIAGAERVLEVMDEREEPEDKEGARQLEEAEGRVVFENVSFGYRPEARILGEISFEVPAGTSVALVGPTGAGKTTIVQLLTRFYEATEGRIQIDGRDIRDYTRDSLRRTFGIVLQDTYLFSGTIRDNIKYGKPEASDDEMKRAAAAANADGFIRRLPLGYDTELSENGSNLSQGERQLLAIARVMLAEPSILILDEATSSIDTRTELHIQNALLEMMKGRTAFIIAHRLSTIRDADRILVVDNGRIVEQGSHDDLVRKEDGIYAGMFASQFNLAKPPAG
ncbi:MULTISPECIES: ABC transporter ATP-binding protein [Cohnella]|uniref:ABC transporter ATP-binding protein n=1 Tax=Cohnella TaxID=329857 RepID=UPI0009BADB91|nr:MULTISPECIES: ABC transporter ATP-binding protein [Cohnella]MBN2984881.1 ABC transporter ATP-binding protein [Cohnella algarum]